MQTKQLHKTILILEEVWAVMMSMTLILVTWLAVELKEIQLKNLHQKMMISILISIIQDLKTSLNNRNKSKYQKVMEAMI